MSWRVSLRNSASVPAAFSPAAAESRKRPASAKRALNRRFIMARGCYDDQGGVESKSVLENAPRSEDTCNVDQGFEELQLIPRRSLLKTPGQFSLGAIALASLLARQTQAAATQALN